MDKIKFWDLYSSWEEAEDAWDRNAKTIHLSYPLRGTSCIFKKSPLKETETKIKSIKYLLKQDKNKTLRRYIFKRPIKFFMRFVKSFFQKNSYRKENQFYLFGVKSLKEFEKKILEKNSRSHLVVGFSYCHKPLECPSKRFSEECKALYGHPVCSQCFIGKCINSLPSDNTTHFILTNTTKIGERLFSIIEENRKKKIYFAFTACPFSMRVFGHFSNVLKLKGIGAPLEGNVCDNMPTFCAAERGKKNSLTYISRATKKTFLQILSLRRKSL